MSKEWEALIAAVWDLPPMEATSNTQKWMRSLATRCTNIVTLAIYVFLVMWSLQLIVQFVVQMAAGIPTPELAPSAVNSLVRVLPYLLHHLPLAFAVLIGALASVAAALMFAVRFLLTDGEEAPAGFSDFYAEGLRGSKAYAAAHARELREVIVLDFIALHDLRLVRDRTADALLWSRLRGAAVRAKTAALFPLGEQGAVIDDHTPFLEAGIPAIDLIDFRYRCWQKLCDDLSQVSQANLQKVGSTVLELIRSDRLRRIR